MAKLKIGVMGAYRGKTMIDVLMVYREDAELVAICDMFEPALKNVKHQAEDLGLNDITYYTEFDEFIKHDMDAVVLANYAIEHAPFAVKCLKAGKHVLSEVLPCETMAQAVELIEAVEQSGKVYAYAENYCYMKDTFEMWKTYQKGEIGEIEYAEGEYVHDCTSVWPQISYGDKNHWRNRMYPTFYCTHSLGPILTVTGKRPVKVSGFETPPNKQCRELIGKNSNAGIEMVTLDNGAVVKSLHGGLKREPARNSYLFYCENGMMESGRFDSDQQFNYYQQGNKVCKGEWKQYEPISDIRPEFVSQFKTHGGSDFYSTYFFIQKCLGKPDGKWYLLRDDITSILFQRKAYEPNATCALSFRFSDHAFRLEPGDWLRVDVASGCAQFAPHANVKGQQSLVREPKTAHNRIFADTSELVLHAL